MCCPEGGGREGLPLSRPRPQPSRCVCSFALCILCQNPNRNTNPTDSSQAGDAHGRLVCVPVTDARALAVVGSVQRWPA